MVTMKLISIAILKIQSGSLMSFKEGNLLSLPGLAYMWLQSHSNMVDSQMTQASPSVQGAIRDGQ